MLLFKKQCKRLTGFFKTSAPSFITSYFQILQNFNPFNSKTWKLITPSSAEPQEPSYKDFEVSAPIVVDHTHTKIDTTSFSIVQIKQDIPRMDIYVNNLRCETIEDFAMYLGLTLNTTKTDILPTDNPLIPKILHFSHQGLHQSGYFAFKAQVEKYSDKFPAPATEKPLSIHISWDPTSPETTEITGEVSFHIKCMTTGNILPCIYTVKTKCSLDKEEITWEAIEEEKDIESSFVFVDTRECESLKELEKEGQNELPDIQQQEDIDSSYDDLAEELEANSKSIDACKEDSVDKTLIYSLENSNSPLQPGMTSAYLTALKNKYPDLVYNDRLMYGNVSVTMDIIVDLLTDLRK